MSFIDRSRPILVTLANGVQGGAVVRTALARGFKVRALVRDRKRASAIAALGAEIVEADLRDRASLARAGAGAGHAILQIPSGPAEEMRASLEHALAAWRDCGLSSLVLKLASASRTAPCTEPSFVANALIEDRVRRSAIPFAIVRPTLYLDNLLKPSARRDLIEKGLFSPPLPATLPIAWTSAEDCAEASLRLLENGVDGGDHRMAGPESLSGEAFAECLSAGLGRPIKYRAQPLDDFEAEVDAAMGPGIGRLVASKFRFFAAHPREADAILSRPFEPGPALRGFQPTTVEDWARRNRDRLLSGA